MKAQLDAVILKTYQDCLNNAEHAERRAVETCEPGSHGTWREVASSWRRMAEQTISKKH